MDDALALAGNKLRRNKRVLVLILVVMDDALARTAFEGLEETTSCLNPCCNG